MCREFLQKAWDAKMADDYAAEETNYLACLAIDPENAEANRELGIMYWGRFNKTQEAIELIEKSLKSEDCAVGHFYLAMVNTDCDRKRALAEFQTAIAAYKLEANDRSLIELAHCYYADLLAQEGDFDEAGKHFSEALRIDPENETIKKYCSYFQQVLRAGEDDSLTD
jgi:tetratricopeptide (TPR) repeat protein